MCINNILLPVIAFNMHCIISYIVIVNSERLILYTIPLNRMVSYFLS